MPEAAASAAEQDAKEENEEDTNHHRGHEKQADGLSVVHPVAA